MDANIQDSQTSNCWTLRLSHNHSLSMSQTLVEGPSKCRALTAENRPARPCPQHEARLFWNDQVAAAAAWSEVKHAQAAEQQELSISEKQREKEAKALSWQVARRRCSRIGTPSQLVNQLAHLDMLALSARDSLGESNPIEASPGQGFVATAQGTAQGTQGTAQAAPLSEPAKVQKPLTGPRF